MLWQKEVVQSRSSRQRIQLLFQNPAHAWVFGVCIASGQSFQQCSGREQGPREGTKSVSLAKTDHFHPEMVFKLDTHKHSLLKDFVNM